MESGAWSHRLVIAHESIPGLVWTALSPLSGGPWGDPRLKSFHRLQPHAAFLTGASAQQVREGG